MLPLRPVFVLAVGLFLAPSWARADFMYTFTNGPGTPTLSGFFSVSDATVASGTISTASEITAFPFAFTVSGQAEGFNSGNVTSITLSTTPPLRVDTTNGNLLPTASGPDPTLKFTLANGDFLRLDVQRFPGCAPNRLGWDASFGDEGEEFVGTRTVTVTHVAGTPLPDPASVVLLASGAPLILLFGWRLRRERAQPLAAS